MKVCSDCGENKSLECFYNQASNKDGLAYRCKDCDRVARARHYHTTKGKILKRNTNRKNKYGITPEDFESLWESQEGCCVICNIKLDDGFSPSHKPNKAVIDHCHDTGNVRGILCTKCNKGLGMFNDSQEVLLRAHEYLRRFTK